MNAKPFQVGDNVWPGGMLAEIPDLDTLEMDGKVEEIDRGRIAVGQDVRVRIDALPELTMPAKLDRRFRRWRSRATNGRPLAVSAPTATSGSPIRACGPGMNGGMDIDRQPHSERHQHSRQSACSRATASRWCILAEERQLPRGGSERAGAQSG